MRRVNLEIAVGLIIENEMLQRVKAIDAGLRPVATPERCNCFIRLPLTRAHRIMTGRKQTQFAAHLLMMITVEPAAERPIKPAASPIEPLAAALERRGLAGPALLYLAGHRPLAFAAGQLLALAAPLAAVLGIDHTMDWAHLLSTPEGVDRLQAALETCRSGLQPDMASAREEGSRRAASPTCEGDAR